MTTANTQLKWRRSCSGGQCVEVARAGDRILMRDSKNPGGPTLGFPADVWMAFVDAVKHDEIHP